MNEATKQYYNNADYNYTTTVPMKLNPAQMTERERELLSSKNFCILPWVHLHGWPTGEAYSCCGADGDLPIGNLKEQTMREVWNGENLRGMRLNMLNDQPSKECKKCYEHESNQIFSMRQSSNKHFGHYIKLTEDTLEDGTVEDFKLRYWDIRFSNICNFMCRSCGPHFSSKWYDDHIALYGDNTVRHPKMLYAGKNKEDIWEQMQEHIPYLEHIYFAGGEPLIMDEHYRLLKYLVDNGMTHVHLNYNTNFSELRYKKLDVLELWKKFDTVSVGASLDAMGARGEYMRKGTVWSEIEDNRKRMLDICPYVDFYISPTVSLLNVLHLPDFHMDWVDKGLIRPQDVSINILTSPNYYRVDVLPGPLKAQAIERCREMIEWLDGSDPLNRATSGYKGLINMMESNDKSKKFLRSFLDVTRLMDKHRKETLEETFPELETISDYL